MLAGLLVLSLSGLPARAKPSEDLCRKHFTPAIPGENVLACKYVGGDRGTRELNNQKYLTDIGAYAPGDQDARLDGRATGHTRIHLEGGHHGRR